MTLLSWLPLKVHYAFSSFLAWLLQKVIHYRVQTVNINIARSFPELNYRQIGGVVKDFYRHLADIIVESVWMLTASTEAVGRQVRIAGQDSLNRALDLNRNAVIMVGHLGNWEIFTGLPVITRIRTRHGSCSLIESHQIIRHIVRHREGRQAFFFICDQNPPHCMSRFTADFLNQKTYMIEGPETVAARMGMPVLYCGLIRHGRRDNEARFELITENAAECPEGYITERFARLLEADIREHKSTWLWSHKRWKKRIS